MISKAYLIILFISQLTLNSLYEIYASSNIIDNQKLIEIFHINNDLETDNLIRKLRLEDQIKIVNSLSKSISLKCFLVSKNSDPTSSQKEMVESKILPPQSQIIFKIPKDYIIRNIETPPHIFLNVNQEPQSQYYIFEVTDFPTLAYPRRVKTFNFIPHFIHDPEDVSLVKYYNEKNSLTFSNIPLEIQKKYDNDLGFMIKTLCPQEGIDEQKFFEQRQILNSRYNLDKLFFDNISFQTPLNYRIPQLIHRIWLTSQDNPIEMPLKYIEWAKESMRSNPPSEGWHHIVWIQDKTKLPLTVQRLETLEIEVKEINELDISYETKRNIDQALSAQKFGKASDIIRYLILQIYGGIYADTDYLMAQSYNVFNKLYDFYVGIEPMSIFIGNAFIASRPHHPIINRVIELIDRNLKIEQTSRFYFWFMRFFNIFNISISKIPYPNYLQYVENEKLKTILSTGPIALTIAFYQAAGQKTKGRENHDILLQPTLLYPTTSSSYPNINITKPNESLLSESLGVHFWEGSWYDQKLKSKG